MRLVSLCPSNTEILFALGLGPQVVGVDDWSDWPEGALASLPRVGGDLTSDLNRVQSLRPDLVLASLSVPGMERNVEGLRARGLPHLVLNPHSLDDVLDDIVTVGEACGASDAAAAVVADARRRIGAVQERAAGAGEAGLYWEWWPKPLIAACGRSWVGQMSHAIGARNVFADIDEPSRIVGEGEVIARNPDVLMICWCGTLQRLQEASRVTSRPGWEAVNGVRSGRVHCVPEALFGRPSQRLVDGLELLEQLVRRAPVGGAAPGVAS
jgi:iron complex transport system substrate-binding protein